MNSMSLELYDDTNSKISNLSDNSRPLGFYSPFDGLVTQSFIVFFLIFFLMKQKKKNSEIWFELVVKGIGYTW